MRNLTAHLPNGETVTYRDRKRWLWLNSVLYPLFPFAGIAAHAATGVEAWLVLPLVFAYGVAPLMDWLIGEDQSNPPEAVVPQLEKDHYYRVLTYLTVPLHFLSLIFAAWWATQGLSVWGFLALAVTAGMTSGLGINTGHELGHKKSRLERNLAKIVLAVPAYGHFWIEHNRGHHRDVSTPVDPASSRMGENIYRFAMREIPGAMRRAWQIEHERLTRKGRSVWSTDNDILQSMAITVVLQLGLLLWLGWLMLPFLLIHNVFAWWQLTSANYIEHYGLLRQKLDNGRYERCQPYHSWNSNHTYSNLLLFQLQRHSDHHAHPTRRYQSLRHFDDLPTLPSGYFGMYVVAYIPWLWFRVMDKRLLALPHVQGDFSRINVDPARREALIARYSDATPAG
ncbi:MAG: alkane 1-monooxygenase [Pseudomonadota bacterium]